MQHESAATAAHGGQSPIKIETLADGKAEMHHPEPSALGLAPGGWVSLAIIAIFLIALWKKVPAMLTGSLDNSIAQIRKQLDEAIVARAEADTNAVIARREKMAEDKIAATERAAVADLRAKAADAAAIAAKGIIASRHTAAADSSLVDQTIGAI